MKNAVVQFRSDQVHRKDPQMYKGLRAMAGRPATRSSYVSLRERLSKDSILSRFPSHQTHSVDASAFLSCFHDGADFSLGVTVFCGRRWANVCTTGLQCFEQVWCVGHLHNVEPPSTRREQRTTSFPERPSVRSSTQEAWADTSDEVCEWSTKPTTPPRSAVDTRQTHCDH